jgi:hypothetical protein
MDQVLQLLGAAAILVAFVAAQRRALDTSSTPYLLCNAIGAGILCATAITSRQWGFVVLEGTWALVALGGLIARPRP